MSKKHQSGGLVYSTDAGYFSSMNTPESARETLPKEQQKLKVRTDSRHRAGKLVTLVEGFSGTESDLEDLGKQLKTYCGTGGSVKDGQIVIQGDNREKILTKLKALGYSRSK